MRRATRPAAIPTAALLAAALAGCALPAARRSMVEHREHLDRSGAFQARVREPQALPPLVVADPAIRFAQRSVPLRLATSLPPHLGDVRLHYPGRLPLVTVAEAISRLIELPVVMTPDALQSAADYAPGDLSAPAAEPDLAPDEAAALRLAGRSGARRLDLSPAEHQNTVELNYAGPLAGLLDRVASQAGLQWTYGGGRIVFSRVVTRAIAVKALPNGLATTASFDVLGGGSDSGGSGAAKVDFSAQSDYWAGLTDSLKGLLSTRAKLLVDPRSGLVTVTDAVANVEAAQAYLDAINTNLMRQVVLEVEVLQVSFSDQFSAGIDWHAMLGRLGRGNALEFTGPAALGPIGGGATAALSFVLGASASRESPSKWVAKALQEYGRVSTAYSSVVTTTNRMPVPMGALQTISYVQRATAAVVNPTTGAVSPGALEPGKLSTGLGLTVLPVILDSNRVLLQTALQVSELRQLRSFASGTGTSAQSVQLPETMSFSAMQRVSVPAGQTLVLAGFEREQTQLDDADILRGLLPLARRGSRGKQGTVVLITPRLTEL
ncbi:hypothetical protein CDN99_07260 [Roseateles aquatilis]|uniref:Type II/III secretion system secretin-like domain-containing protein n=1 Tax=Roseateles aquatilis TaxID=431061 RepID=A0A246JHQ6_9BURK|nr:hypothetical protein [Roseateles aquatilis]OWQ92141.1 hypothetical protein CDN99_07260 [Roseateles aquatilis]